MGPSDRPPKRRLSWSSFSSRRSHPGTRTRTPISDFFRPRVVLRNPSTPPSTPGRTSSCQVLPGHQSDPPVENDAECKADNDAENDEANDEENSDEQNSGGGFRDDLGDEDPYELRPCDWSAHGDETGNEQDTTSSLRSDAGEEYTGEDHSDPEYHHPDDDDDDETTPPVERAAAELLKMLLEDQNGCTAAEHRHEHSLHMAQEGVNHHDLSVTYQSPLASAPSSRTEVGLYSDVFPPNLGMPRRVYTRADVFTDVFEGTATADEPVRNVCLHEEAIVETAPLQSFDFDSVLVFTRTLAAFRRGFRYCPVKQIKYNIRHDLHLERPVYSLGPHGQTRRRRRPLRDIPHLYLGSVDGLHNAAVFVFFPWLSDPDQQGAYLTDAQVARFIDQAMWPASKQHLTDDRIQHFPPTQEIAEINARAKGVEHQTYSGERGRKQYTTFLIPPDSLPDISNTLHGRIHEPCNGLLDFRDAFFFVDVKGIKLDFKVTGSLFQAVVHYEERIGEIFDVGLVDDLVQDVGKEICPPSPHSIHGDRDNDPDALVYLWRTCCLQRQHRSLVEGPFEGKQGRVQFFHLGFLRDAACMTVVPPKTSWIGRSGWFYGQWYASAKEIGDAQACYPFDKEELTELAVDEGLWMASASSAKVSHRKSRAFLIRSYCGGKMRVRKTYREAIQTSFGTRMEFRIGWGLLQALKRQAGEREASASLPIRLSTHPPSAWPLTTRNYVEFVLGNYDKFMTALETTSLTSPKTGVPLERSRFMICLIRCIQRFANSIPRRESALWYDTRTVKNVIRKGVGFESTMPACGFGWFIGGVVDWEDLRFTTAVAGAMVINDRALLAWHRGGGRTIQDTGQVLDLCFERLLHGCRSTAAQDDIVRFMAHLCFRQFRRDVLAALHKELRRAVTTDEEKDAVSFCYDGLREAFIDAPKLVESNRTKIQQPGQLTEWIWGSSTEWNRKFFVHRPFRVMYEKVEAAVKGRVGLAERWRTIFPSEFLAYHWVMPYPDPNGTLISTAKGSRARQWWAIDRPTPRHEWRWARGSWRRGRPPAYPAALAMGGEDLMTYLARLS